MAKKRRCDWCKFSWRYRDKINPERKLCQCGYGPPTTGSMGYGMFPIMSAKSWCFRFELDEEKAQITDEVEKAEKE